MDGSRPRQNAEPKSRWGDTLQFGCSALALWALCALGIYLIQPSAPQGEIPLALISHALAAEQVAAGIRAEDKP